MQTVLIAMLLVILIGLGLEQRRTVKDRSKLMHVVYVNGIRGKSSTTRLIDSGLRAGGYRVFSKTTGTVPMTIGVDGVSRPLYRRGRANIKEQLKILHRAARDDAQILVLECMAVDPELQSLSQHRMVRADIGVITNVRLDHTEEMGETLEEICESLSNTIPKDGVLFTADPVFFPQLERNAQRINCRAMLSLADGTEPEIDFPENVALALAVCQHLGVDRSCALEGMTQYQRDPFALSVHRLPGGGVFVNGMSINDPQSTKRVFSGLSEKYGWSNWELVLIINNRPDRGYRTQHMVTVARELSPDRVWLLGTPQATVKKQLLRDGSVGAVTGFRRVKDVPLEQATDKTVVFAVGNVAGAGHDLMRRIREVAEEDVS